MEIVEKKLGKRQVAYVAYKGSYEEVPVLMGEIVGFIMAKGLSIMGPPFWCILQQPPGSACGRNNV